MAINRETNVVDLQYLFLAPISAVIDADFQAAHQFVASIEKYGFKSKKSPTIQSVPDDGDEGFVGDLRMVSFRYDRAGADGTVQPRLMRLPALSMVPLPLLQVKDAEFEFGVRLLAAVERQNLEPVRILGPAGSEPVDATRFQWRALLAADVPQRPQNEPDLAPHLDANIRAKVRVVQSDIPAGISRLLALMGENAQSVSGSIEPRPAALTLSPGGEARVVVTAFTFEGRGAPSHALRADYDDSLGLRLRTSEGEWRSGEAVTTDARGRVECWVSLDANAPLPLGGHTSISFRAEVDELPLTAKLPVRLEG